MNLSTLAALYARATPHKAQVALPLLMMAVLCWLPSLPGAQSPDDPEIYALFCRVPPSLYGVFDEWHQCFVPGRYASLTDAALDVAGAAPGIWLAAWMSRHALSSAAAVAARDA